MQFVPDVFKNMCLKTYSNFCPLGKPHVSFAQDVLPQCMHMQVWFPQAEESITSNAFDLFIVCTFSFIVNNVKKLKWYKSLFSLVFIRRTLIKFVLKNDVYDNAFIPWTAFNNIAKSKHANEKEEIIYHRLFEFFRLAEGGMQCFRFNHWNSVE